MKKAYLIIFIAVFCVIIYSVPVLQTVYEFTSSEDHRIQVGDLVTDLFVTPLEKSRKMSAELDSLAFNIDHLYAEVKNGAGSDTTQQWDTEKAIEFADNADVNLTLLRQSIRDYNRHIQGDKNRFAAADTVKPLYRTICSLTIKVTEILDKLQSGVSAPTILPAVSAAVTEAASAHAQFGHKKGILAYPALTLEAFRRIMVGADYLRPYEKDIEKRSLVANAVRPWVRLSYYAAFGDLGDKAIHGKKEWFFYRPDVEYLTKPPIDDIRSKIVDPNDVPIRDAVVDSIKAFSDQLAARGIDLLVVFIPGKPSIYPELLAGKTPAAPFSHTLETIDKLSSIGVNTVNLFAALSDERKNDSVAGDSIYLHTDTHFRSRAVAVTARVVADRIKQFSWFTPGDVEYAIDTLHIDRNGDIGEMAKLPQVTLPIIGLPFPSENTTCYQVLTVERDATGTILKKTPYKDDYRNATILVLGDSFSRIYQTDTPRSAGWISHLAYDLKQPVVSIVNDGGASTLVRQSLAQKPKLLKGKKIVVWEIVERDLRFGAEGWKNIVLSGL